jgi:Holliday junction resolvase RusA-like endonuclease
MHIGYTMTDHSKIEIHLGKIPSLNKFYSSPHWTFRSKEKTKWREVVMQQLDYDFQFEYCVITAKVNYRYDLDNCIMAVKFTQDALVEAGLIKDDNKKFIKAVRIEPASDLPKDTSVIVIEGKIFK